MQIDITIPDEELGHIEELADVLLPNLPGEDKSASERIAAWLASMVLAESFSLERKKHLKKAAEEETSPGLIVNAVEWLEGVRYKRHQAVAYGGVMYHARVTHTSGAGHTPDVVPSLWSRFRDPNTVEKWVQPHGAHDAYNSGDIVKHNGQNWRSTINSNIWEPGVIGWEVHND